MKGRLYQYGFRTKVGSSISEFAPALFLLFFFAVFPMINLIFLGLIFSSCVTLNNAELSEAAKTPNSQLASIFSNMQSNWQSTGIGRLTNGATSPQSEISYSNIGIDAYVTVATTFTVKPFFTVPFFNTVPGLGAPWSFTVSGKKVLESARYANL